MHNLLAHPVFFVTQFVDDLHSDVRYAVVLHRPQDLDTTVALACLQEEVLESTRRDPHHIDIPSRARSMLRTVLPLPPPPGKTTPMGGTRADNRKGTKGARATSFDDKLVALCAYRCAKGLRHTCGKRWSREHKCVPTVQLNVVEELLEMLRNSNTESQCAYEDDSQIEADLLAISQEALTGSKTARTMRLQGVVQGHEVIMLLDSESSHCFISEEFARLLVGNQPSLKPVQVRIVNCGMLRCTREFPRC